MLDEPDPIEVDLRSDAAISAKFKLVLSLMSAAFEQCRRSIREQHPEYSEQEVSIQFVEMNYGTELAEGFRCRLERDRIVRMRASNHYPFTA